jgi:hypothetical protein
MSGLRCQNCGTSRRVARRSWDLDLPPLTLCDVCALMIATDAELFEQMGRRNGKRGRS